jgi:hypothetical protein
VPGFVRHGASSTSSRALLAAACHCRVSQDGLRQRLTHCIQALRLLVSLGGDGWLCGVSKPVSHQAAQHAASVSSTPPPASCLPHLLHRCLHSAEVWQRRHHNLLLLLLLLLVPVAGWC